MRNDNFRNKPPKDDFRHAPRTGGTRSVPPARRAGDYDEGRPYHGNGYRPHDDDRPFERERMPKHPVKGPHKIHYRTEEGRPMPPRPDRPPRRDDRRPMPPRPDRPPMKYRAPRPVAPVRPVAVVPPIAPIVPPMPAEALYDAIEVVEAANLLVGRNPIREALRAGKTLEKLIVASGDLSGAAMDIIRMAKEAGVVVQSVDRARLDQIYPAHQGMVAYVPQAEYVELEDILAGAIAKGEDPFIIVLDGITDPHNLGAIIRSAECAGAHGVVIPERRSVGLTPACAKAAAGALSHMPVARVTNLNRAIEQLKSAGVWCMAAAMDGEDAFHTDLTGPIALIIGSEGNGISNMTLQKCDRRISLPMYGHIDSLNASVAAGILMYQVVHARRSKQ